MSRHAAPARRVLAWATLSCALLAASWWALSSVLLAVDEAAVPPASALSQELRAVAQGEGRTDCGSGGCWRTWGTTGADGPEAAAAERCTGVNFLPFRKTCSWVGHDRGVVTVNVRYSQ